ncbi:outer membrane lipoprotein chaperone LolA [Candidatus Persebacteraceae bacterium Df01]|uniref:Outer-membrane lipoprotein carrier protein n=1 Tax=Candidatus Doriopsillibacter californiensis TaxID=2970740 RepID=A0ABT7QLM2_9GAMM|nr:outer membrane lipoprotein chaperone LolA [Candidatus Persebacteraceae bacterium Df01]
MRQLTRLGVLLVAVLISQVVQAADGLVLLRDFLRETPSARLDFHQTALDEKGNVLTESGGRLWYERPAKFRMEYDKPEELLLVSDGETAWIYEPDLQQATTQPAATLIGDSVLFGVLSGGDWEALQTDYVLTAGLGGDWRWAIAEAKDDSQTVRRWRLAFSANDGQLRQVEITDSFGGIARLDVLSLTQESAVFTFTPPPGVDVVRGQ